MKFRQKLLLFLALLGCICTFCRASQVTGNTEVMGVIKPPDDDVLGKPSSRGIHADRKEAVHMGTLAPRPRVSVLTVAILTFIMAVVSGFGTVPFFFFELDDRWKGSCNGIACGVMLAASFDLISEGQAHGGGTCVMLGILLGGLFIIVSEKVLEGFGDVKMVDISSASVRRMVTIVAVMTLHSVGEGSGVGVSFAGPKGFSQGLLVTIAIGVHNIPEGMAVSMVLTGQGVKPFRAMLWSIFTSLPQFFVAVPAFMFAGVFTQLLPLCMGFAAGCMIWIVFGEIMPEALEEGAKGSHIATAATVSVAVMEWLSTSLMGLDQPPQWDAVAPFILSTLFILGPLLGGLLLMAVRLVLPLHAALLTGLAAGSVAALSLLQPLQFVAAGKLPALQLLGAFVGGSVLYVFLSRKLELHKRHAKEDGILGVEIHSAAEIDCSRVLTKALEPWTLGLTPGVRLTGLITLALCAHSFAEGLMLGVASAPKSAGLGMAMLLPVAIHGLPRGVAAAATMLGLTGSSLAPAVLAATASGLAGPLGAVAALSLGLDYRGLDLWLTAACGLLLPLAVIELVPRAVGFDKRRALFGCLLGAAVVLMGYTATRAVCASTSYCNSAPEALT